MGEVSSGDRLDKQPVIVIARKNLAAAAEKRKYCHDDPTKPVEYQTKIN